MWLAVTLPLTGCIYMRCLEMGCAVGSCARSATPHPTIIQRLGLSGLWPSVVVPLIPDISVSPPPVSDSHSISVPAVCLFLGPTLWFPSAVFPALCSLCLNPQPIRLLLPRRYYKSGHNIRGDITARYNTRGRADVFSLSDLKSCRQTGV